MFDMNPLKRNTGKPSDTQDVESTRPPVAAPSKPSESYVRSTGLATIGPSISIKGDLNGEEDLIIQGRVEGTINLKQNNLTVGQNGDINANVYARTITVEGTLKGDIYGEEKVVIKKSGNVKGNVTAPRVSLEDGARFKGSMDMDYKKSESGAGRNDTASVFKLDKSQNADKAAPDAKGAIK
ncbi:MAG: polymer-forming cytoskeletal protein [Gammaproteobacteria bacterium]|jgi:cytoskeletal protein CcmA (bactofilin family)